MNAIFWFGLSCCICRFLFVIRKLCDIWWYFCACWKWHRLDNPHISKVKHLGLVCLLASADHSMPYEHSAAFDNIIVDFAMHKGELSLISTFRWALLPPENLFCYGVLHLQITPCLMHTLACWTVIVLMLESTQVEKNSFLQLLYLSNSCAVIVFTIPLPRL